MAKLDPQQGVVLVSSAYVIGKVGIPEPHQMFLWLLTTLSNMELILALAYK